MEPAHVDVDVECFPLTGARTTAPGAHRVLPQAEGVQSREGGRVRYLSADRIVDVY